MHSYYLDAIRNFEGFTPKAAWDYAQFSNGYGTRARFDGEVIDRAEAERRFRSEISQAREIVERSVPHVDEGTKAALTSLTYNAGTSWIRSGLGEAVRAGDLDTAREIFQKYNRAGGEVLPGLARRRAAEVEWIGNPGIAQHGQVPGRERPTGVTMAAASYGVESDRDHSAQRVARLIQKTGAQTADEEAIRSRTGRAEGSAAWGEAEPDDASPRVAALTQAAAEALLALSEADRLTSERVADMARAAQLSRGSELGKVNKDSRKNETRWI